LVKIKRNWRGKFSLLFFYFAVICFFKPSGKMRFTNIISKKYLVKIYLWDHWTFICSIIHSNIVL
jgi:hypothetical protein